MNRHRDRDEDRRREQRVRGTGLRARVRPGNLLIVVDLSACGALVEAGRPLRPGSYVDMQLETDARRETVAARVVRCAVAAIDWETGITYRAALAFTETCDWVREVLTQAVHGVPSHLPGGSTPAAGDGDGLLATRDERA
jgi:PilZ domain-containing protein